MTRPDPISAFSAFDEEEYTSRSWAKGGVPADSQGRPYNSNLAYRIFMWGAWPLIVVMFVALWWVK